MAGGQGERDLPKFGQYSAGQRELCDLDKIPFTSSMEKQ